MNCTENSAVDTVFVKQLQRKLEKYLQSQKVEEWLETCAAAGTLGVPEDYEVANPNNSPSGNKPPVPAREVSTAHVISICNKGWPFALPNVGFKGLGFRDTQGRELATGRTSQGEEEVHNGVNFRGESRQGVADDGAQARQGGNALGFHPPDHINRDAFGAQAAHLPAAESDVGRSRPGGGRGVGSETGLGFTAQIDRGVTHQGAPVASATGAYVSTRSRTRRTSLSRLICGRCGTS